MYLGIDFLIDIRLRPYLIEVNVGLPGGAQEYHLTHLVKLGEPSDIFSRIEETSWKVYGRGFQEYLDSLPLIESLKPFKLWMDGMGPYPERFHPGLRLEDKWTQYRLLSPLVLMPETALYDPLDREKAQGFLTRRGRLVLKRRVGRGGRGFQVVTDLNALPYVSTGSHACLLQEYIESRVDTYALSIRSVAFGGEFMCMYANLSQRSFSNHGILAFVSEGDRFGLGEGDFETACFDQRSWEAELWFGPHDPHYLRHNLYEDEVARTAFCVPGSLYRRIKETSVTIERFYEGIDVSRLPRACFEG